MNAAWLWTGTFVFLLLGTATVQSDEPWQANPELVKKQGARGDFNYDESRVPAYTLPNPLVTTDGKPVDSVEGWTNQRRPELMSIFRDQVYGRRPTTPYELTFELVSEDDKALDGKAIARTLRAVIRVGDDRFEFPFVVFLPQSGNDLPGVILINNRRFISAQDVAQEHDPFWPVRNLIDRGYATASFHTSDVDPDRKDGYAEGVRAFFAKGAEPEQNAWRSLSAWGWAASRLLDYWETVDRVDAKRVAVVGHSRGGKTALWAGSEDERFAISYSNNSGCGGAALSRRAYGETVARITTSFPHWFTPNFAKYGGHEQDLPIDQHELIGLIAPRAVYVTSADEDLWADPKGEYASLVAAAPVFALHGTQPITAPVMPALGEQRISGPTGYHIRAGGHGLEQADWDQFLDFADQILK